MAASIDSSCHSGLKGTIFFLSQTSRLSISTSILDLTLKTAAS